MISKGDSEKQAVLRDSMIKKSKIKRSRYVSKILTFFKPVMKILDIGCGTIHIIQELASNRKTSEHVGLDVSNAMLKLAKENCGRCSNINLVLGDGLILPFPDETFDLVITKLAEYSPQETYRVLKKDGVFFEYSLGPEADKEIAEFFPERIEPENFFFLHNLKEWKQEIIEPMKKIGFIVSEVQEYKGNDYYCSEEEVMDLIEMVPLIKNFDREKDRALIKRLVEKYQDTKVSDSLGTITYSLQDGPEKVCS
jgi:ubiquinone/menaquinone biosynthesis C-methylase UbiE